MAGTFPLSGFPDQELLFVDEDESSSYCSSTGDPEDMTVFDCDGENQRQVALFSSIVFWRNLLLACVTGTGIVLSVAAQLVPYMDVDKVSTLNNQPYSIVQYEGPA